MEAKTRKNLNRISILVSYGSILVGLLGSFFITPIVLENVGDDNYGLYSFCTSLTNWLTVLTTAVASSYIYFSKKEIKDTGGDSKTNALFRTLFCTFALAITAILLCIVPALYFSKVSFPNYTLEESLLIYILLAIAGAQVVVSILLNFYHHFLISRQEFFFVRSKNVLVEILGYALNVIFALTTKSILLIAVSSIITTLASGVSNLLWARHIGKPTFASITFKDSRDDYKAIAKYVAFVILNTAVTTLNNTLDKTILGFMGLASMVTIYQLSFSFSSYINIASGLISETYMPQIHEYYSQGQDGKSSQLFLLISKIQLLLLGLIVGGFISCGQDFINLWVGENRFSVYYYASALLLINIVPFSMNTSTDCERAKNKHKFRAITLVGGALLNVLVSLLLVLLLDESLAIWACIIGTVVSKIITEWIVMPIYDKKTLNLPIKDFYLSLIKSMTVMVICSAVCLVTRHFIFQYFGSLVLFLIIGAEYVALYGIYLLVLEKKRIMSFVDHKKSLKVAKISDESGEQVDN